MLNIHDLLNIFHVSVSFMKKKKNNKNAVLNSYENYFRMGSYFKKYESSWLSMLYECWSLVQRKIDKLPRIVELFRFAGTINVRVLNLTGGV